MAFVGMLRKMLKDEEIGKLVVPIVPDEARTFGMESLFRTAGISDGSSATSIGAISGYPESVGNSINNHGTVVGGSISAGSIRDWWETT